MVAVAVGVVVVVGVGVVVAVAVGVVVVAVVAVVVVVAVAVAVGVAVAMKTSLDSATMAARVDYDADELFPGPAAFHVVVDLSKLRGLYIRAYRQSGGVATNLGGAIRVERREPTK